MHASAPFNFSSTSGVYVLKSFMTITSTFGSLEISSGSGLRVSAMIDVIEGFCRHWWRTSSPIKPVTPVRMYFMFAKVVVARLMRDEDMFCETV